VRLVFPELVWGVMEMVECSMGAVLSCFFDFKGVSMQVVVAGSAILLVGGKQCWSGILARIGGKNFLVNLFFHI